MSAAKAKDMEAISSLEEQLRGEVSARQRLEAQLREQRTQVLHSRVVISTKMCIQLFSNRLHLRIIGVGRK